MAVSLRLILALALLALAGPAAPRPRADADPALWLVRDADTRIYLFGTVHVLKPDMGWFDDGVKRAFDRSDTLVLELVTPDAAEMKRLVDELGTSASGPPLSDKLPADRRAKLAAAFAELGWPAGSYERYEPWLAATTLSVLPLKQLGYDDAHAPEAVLRRAAQAKHKQLLGLETARQQFAMFDALPEPDQLALLVRTLDGLPRINETIERTLDAWRRGDDAAMAGIVEGDLGKAPTLAETLLRGRNARWADWIAARMAQPGRVFVAVGAGHLAGPASLQVELAKRGLKVERVRY